MITKKTTKQILKEYLILKEMSNNKLGGQSKNDFQEDLNNKVWVCLDELKKEIPQAVDNAVNEFLNDYPKARTKIVFNLQSYIEVKLRDLCNSQEQKGDERK